MFGLPPLEPTYFVRWTFDMGDLLIDSHPRFIDVLLSTVSALGFGYTDAENGLGIPEVLVRDITNLLFNCPEIRVKLHGEDYVLDAILKKLKVKLSDQATNNFNMRINCDIGEILVSVIKGEHKVLDLKTSLRFTDFVQKEGGYQLRQDQIKHYLANDAPFHRGPFMLPEDKRDRKYNKKLKSIVPSMPLPDVPAPLNPDTADHLIKSFPQTVQFQLEWLMIWILIVSMIILF
ncbi:unnamed protein product [Ambrosiozyma monospora]|uniref:Unnamed protein product n=1 Tax=Ambrosiozyma monospora TaxID=43982 RepID=A0A9W6WJY1_AMBMO|nr:unnamed protein product [Ambrosiozyma monospora]